MLLYWSYRRTGPWVVVDSSGSGPIPSFTASNCCLTASMNLATKSSWTSTRGSNADLSGVEEEALAHRAYHNLKWCIVEHNGRRFATQFQGGSLEVRLDSRCLYGTAT